MSKLYLLFRDTYGAVFWEQALVLEKNENTIPALQESVLQFIRVIRVQITEASIPKIAAAAGPRLLSSGLQWC